MALARMEEEGSSNTGSPAGDAARINRSPARGRPGRAGWRIGPYYRRGGVMPVEGRGLECREVRKGGKAWPLTNV